MPGGECCILPLARPRRVPLPVKAVPWLQLTSMPTDQAA